MFTGELLPYQPEAVNRMCERGSMLVAYDLGLGKTVLTIAAIERLMDEGKITEPGLIICLSSLKYQWAQQITKFTSGTSTPLVIDGTPKQRNAQYEKAMSWKSTGVDYIIVNYEQVVNDWDKIKKLPRGFIVTDEATAIKSFRSKRSKYVKKLVSNYRFALTGTPVENGKPEELYSIMQFVDSTVLGRFDIFDNAFIVRNKFGGVERYRNLSVLNERLKTACVRKRQEDSDVAPYLPETIFAEPVIVPFDKTGKYVYQKIVNDLITDLDEALDSFGGSFDIFSHYGQSDQGGHGDMLRGSIMSKLTALRMICDHPELLRISADKYDSGKLVVDQNKSLDLPGANGGSSYASLLKAEGLLEQLTKAPKLLRLVEYVSDFLDEFEGNKIVIFTSYVDMTEIIKSNIKSKSVVYTGQMTAKEKEAAKLKFQNDPEIKVFISSDAGGYGVDLPQANLLINYDLPWNAGLAVQRNGRIRRASSEWKHIVVQDILMANSIEERQREMLNQKTSVANAVVDGEGINEKGGLALTVGSLRQFLMDIQL
jgi:SNF2 family DNA or RNA helicase